MVGARKHFTAGGQTTFREFFGSELRRRRNQNGMTQEQFGRVNGVNYSQQMVAALEAGTRTPTRDLAKLCDQLFGTDGMFDRVYERITREKVPGWFRPFVDLEARAAAIHTFEVSLIPGLLQTEDYARAVIAAGQRTETLDELVAARLERQQVLGHDDPPHLTAILDEEVIRRPVGGSRIMRRQLESLVALTSNPRATIQVVPATKGAYPGLEGAFTILEFDEDPDAGYIERSGGQGWLIEHPVVGELRIRFNLIRSCALPADDSLKLINACMEAI